MIPEDGRITQDLPSFSAKPKPITERDVLRRNFSKEAATYLLMTGRFGNPLNNSDEVAIHNDRMKLLRTIVGVDNMGEFTQKVVEAAYNF